MSGQSVPLTLGRVYFNVGLLVGQRYPVNATTSVVAIPDTDATAVELFSVSLNKRVNIPFEPATLMEGLALRLGFSEELNVVVAAWSFREDILLSDFEAVRSIVTSLRDLLENPGASVVQQAASSHLFSSFQKLSPFLFLTLGEIARVDVS